MEYEGLLNYLHLRENGDESKMRRLLPAIRSRMPQCNIPLRADSFVLWVFGIGSGFFGWPAGTRKQK
jgi:hypothetical protein